MKAATPVLALVVLVALAGTPAAAAPAAENRIASAALLRLADFPAGWTASDRRSSPGNSRCAGVAAARSRTSARAVSPDFRQGEATQVSHVVYLYTDEAEARASFAAISSGATRACLGHRLAKGLGRTTPSGVHIGPLTTSELKIAPAGQQSAAGRITIPLSANGASTEVDVDVVMVRQGRGLSLQTFVQAVQPFDEKLRGQLVTAAAQRLQSALRR